MLNFNESEPLTLGAEIELQLLDPGTLDLTSHSPMILDALGGVEGVKAELFQSMLEVNTGICRSAHQIESDLKQKIDLVREVTEPMGIKLSSSGTHPFASHVDRLLYPDKRYQEVIDRNRWIARRLVIFGLHVHVGMRSGEHAIQVNNALLHYLPLMLAISASSPYWHGEDTELASSRITFFESLPTGGHPCVVGSWSEFETLYGRLVRSGAIRSPKDIWWDIRPSPDFGTLEVRICDVSPTLRESKAIVALVHTLCAFIDRHLMQGKTFAPPADWIIRENKWRASRFGTDASFVVDPEGATKDLKTYLGDLQNELAEEIEAWGYVDEFAFLNELVEKGASYKRQRAVFGSSNGNLRSVAKALAAEFDAERPIWTEPRPVRLRKV